jgi:uncharacterized protein (TIGR02246 family)
MSGKLPACRTSSKEIIMPAYKPEDMHQLFVEAFNRKDEEALLALYETNATLVPQPGQPVMGVEAIRAALQGFLALNGKMSIETVYCIKAGDLALARGHWRLTGGAGPNGEPVELQGNTVEVMRRQPDGGWRYAVDDPYGAD